MNIKLYFVSSIILLSLINQTSYADTKKSNKKPQTNDIRQAYIMAVRNQENTTKLNQWLSFLINHNWNQGYEPSDFSKANKNQKTEKLLSELRARVPKISNSKLRLTIEIPNLIPEAITFDGNRLFIGSLKLNSVFVKDNNRTEVFAKLNEPVYAIKYRQGKLWVLSNDLQKQSYLTIFDGKSKKLIKRYSSPQISEFNDLVFVDNIAYITDTRNDRIVTPSDSNNQLNTFFASSKLRYPNGIASDGQNLFIASSNGIFRLNLSSQQLTRVNVSNQSLAGIDGLYWNNGSLIAIQNASGASRVIQIENPNNKPKIKTLESRNNYFDIPTNGTIKDDEFFYIANSQLLKFDSESKINKQTYILSIKL